MGGRHTLCDLCDGQSSHKVVGIKTGCVSLAPEFDQIGYSQVASREGPVVRYRIGSSGKSNVGVSSIVVGDEEAIFCCSCAIDG